MKHFWLFIFVIMMFGCNEVEPGSCYPNPAGGAGGGGSIPTTSVGATSGTGDFPADNEPLASGDEDSACNDPCMECDQQALLREYLENAEGTGGVICTTPVDCVNKCVAQAKYCSAAHAVHPYKPPMVGDLYDCIDSFPSAKNGGSYTCLYRYPNGDACIFAYASKFGPLKIPAPPPLCVYKSQ